MKKMLYSLTASMLLMVSFATFTMAQSVDGDWDFTTVSPQGERTTKVNIKQSGESLTGKYGPFDLTGSVKGADVTIKFTAKIQDNDFPITLTGKLNGAAMGGKADFGGMAEGDWSAKKSATASATTAPATAASAAPSTGVANTWNLTYTSPVGEFPVTLSEIQQEGETITGKYKLGGQNPQEGPFKGTIKGDAVELKIVIKYEGNDLPITSKGKLTGSEVKGTVDYGGMAEGEFKGKKN